MDLQELSGVNYKMLSEGLEESVEELREEILRVKNTNRILRKVNGILRDKGNTT